MRQSNGYVVIFTVAMTVICGGLLAGVAVALKPQHKLQKELDTKSKILSAYEPIAPGQDIQKLYAEKVEGIVINYKGEIVEKDADGNEIIAANIDPSKEYKKKNVEDKLLPVYKIKDEVNEGKFSAYVVPVYGAGLWDAIWGYVALGSDFNTIQGTVFDHKAETPGLGARITDKNVQDRFIGKKIFDESGSLESVAMVKGEGNVLPDDAYHKVDGLSGATMTSTGLNKMLAKYFSLYLPYFQEQRGSQSVAESNQNVKNSEVAINQ